MNKTALAILLTTGFASTQTLAAELPQAGSYIVGAQLSFGNINHDNFPNDEDGVAQLMFFLDYYVKPGWALEVGVSTGTNVHDWICEHADETDVDDDYCDNNNSTISFENDLDFTNFILAVRFDQQVSENSFVYGKLGAQYYDYEMSGNHQVFEQDNGTGIYSELGWRYQWSNRITANVGYQHIGMHDLTTSSLAFGVGYQF